MGNLFNVKSTNKVNKYYTVISGKVPGIYTSWEECKEQVIGVPNAIYKSFYSYDEAYYYFTEQTKKVHQLFNEDAYTNYYKIYTDGSNIGNTIYAFGFVVLDPNNNVICKAYKGYEPNELSKHRNISGECFGVIEALNYCKENNINDILIYHDYLGLKRWAEGDWQANSPISILYKNKLNDYKNIDNLNFKFVWVKGHNGDKWNEEADRLAKLGLNTFSLTFE
jgi:ribonuclease HI